MATPRQYRAAASRGTFIGREVELGVLEEAAENARSGQPCVVLIEGPAGIGKSALIAHFLGSLEQVTVLRASGDESEIDVRFGVVDQLLRRAGEVHPHADDHVEAGARMLDLIGRLEDERPVVLVLDDAHWADVPSLRALLFLVRRLVVDRVLVAIATRQDAAALPEGLAKAAAEPEGRTIRLQPLTVEELRALAGAQGVQLTARALQRLKAHAGGNPLYTRALLDELPADAWHRQDRLPAPASLATIVRQRVAACSAETVRLLESAAVLGPRSSLTAAATLGDIEEPLETLEEAEGAGLLYADESTGVPCPTFTHPLFASAVYQQLGSARRARLHASAAKLVDDEDAQLRHLAAAAPGGNDALARRLSVRAERSAVSRSLESAAATMVAAARLSPDPSEREQRLMRAVDWMLAAGDAAQARAFADEIAGFTDGPQRSSILGQLAEFEGRVDEAETLFARAWEQCDPQADPALRAMIAHRNAYHALRSLRDADVVTWAERALRLASDDPLAVGWAGTLALSLWRLGRADEAFRVLEDARTGDETADIHLRGQRGWLRLAGDEIEGARADLEAATAGELRMGSLLFSAIRLTELSLLQYVTGEWADAVVSAERALALASEVEHPHSAFVWWAVIQVPAARGDWTTVDVYARRAAAEPIDATDRTVAVGMALAVAAAARGDAESVVAALAPVAALSPNPAIDEPGFWPWQDLYGEALVGLGRLAEADAFLRPHEARAEQRGRPSPIAKLARVRARVEAGMGRREQASDAFKRALAQMAPLGMPYDEALIHYAHGQFLRRNGRRRAAAEELGRARDTLSELQARPALERCERELAGCGLTPAKRTGAPRADLTPQEEAIARLVVTGRTNRDVASELLLSVKTVEMHLTRIYAKLGVSSRSQLAATPWTPA